MTIRARNRGAQHVVLVTTPGQDQIGGGVLSICSIYEETHRLLADADTEVLLCTLPGEPPLLRYTKFRFTHILMEFSQALSYFDRVQSILIHLPEIYVRSFVQALSARDKARLARIPRVHFNVMLQNIRGIVGQPLDRLKAMGVVTATTAHTRYTNVAIRQELDVPLHKLSTFVSPEQYCRAAYTAKKDILIVSPDRHPMREEILERIRRELPQMQIVVVRNMAYEEYKRLIVAAKWSLTFGEGLDGYFIEPIFSGAISFAVYNERFFTPDFGALATVYASYETLAERIVAEMRSLDCASSYAHYQDEEYRACASTTALRNTERICGAFMPVSTRLNRESAMFCAEGTLYNLPLHRVAGSRNDSL